MEVREEVKDAICDIKGEIRNICPIAIGGGGT
jgi:hypothetical protein